MSSVIEQFAKKLPANGALRRGVRYCESGQVIKHNGDQYELTEGVWVDIEERYDSTFKSWMFKYYFIETMRLTKDPSGVVVTVEVPVVLTRWQRFKRWLGFSNLPEARLLKEKDNV